MNLICKIISRFSTSQYGYIKKDVELYSDRLVVTSESHYGVIGKAVKKDYPLSAIRSLVFESNNILRVDLGENESNDFELKLSSSKEELNILITNLIMLKPEILLDEKLKERKFSAQQMSLFIAIGAIAIFWMIIDLMVKFK